MKDDREDTPLKDKVIAELRRRNIKLWLPPYCEDNRNTPNLESLTRLGIILQQAETLSACGISGSQILQTLQEVQLRALEKLEAKNKKYKNKDESGSGPVVVDRLNLKILGWKKTENPENILCHQNSLERKGEKNAENHSCPSWAQKMFFSDPDDAPSSSTSAASTSTSAAACTKLELHSLNPTLTVEDFVSDLQNFLQVSQIRLIYKGKTLQISEDKDKNSSNPPASAKIGCSSNLLSDWLYFASTATFGTSTLALKNESSKGNISASMICLVSHTPSKPQNTNETTPVNTTNKQSPEFKIQSMRRAAQRLTTHSPHSFHLDITDQHGAAVSMSPSDRQAFVTALGLHRLGRQEMNQGRFDQALLFFLEADSEWNHDSSTGCTRSGTTTSTRFDDGGMLVRWKEKVDNYGLLQLDIAWTYLQLQSLSHLSDAFSRLDLAEKVLKQQVHANFVTLAVVQAELGNAVPPLAAVFVRLFLLQGVAYRHAAATASATSTITGGMVEQEQKAQERLEQATLLCQALRRVAPLPTVQSLCTAMGVQPHVAIAALRQSYGIPDAAAEKVVKAEAEAKELEKRRRDQRRWGVCENGVDWVEVPLIGQLQEVLGLSGVENGENEKVVVSLLRLCNNDFSRAIDLYQDVEKNHTEVLVRATRLDLRLQRERRRRGSGGKKRNREEDPLGQPEQDGKSDMQGDEKNKEGREEQEMKKADDLALATLMSMGMTDENLARRALGSCENNVELALLWLSEKQAIVDQPMKTKTDPEEKKEHDKDDEDAMLSDTPKTLAGQDSAHTGDADTNMATVEHDSKKDTLNQLLRQLRQEKQQEIEEDEDADDVMEWMEKELGEALQEERDLEKEYLGHDLEEEWKFLELYRL